MSEQNNSVEVKGRVLARVLAEDLKDVVGAGATPTITGEPTGGLNGRDITNVGGDGDKEAY